MERSHINNPWRLLLWILFPIILCIIGIIAILLNGFPRQTNHQEILETAIYSVSPPQQATLSFCDTSTKVNLIFSHCIYKTTMTHDEIEAYYIQALSDRGWRYIGSDTAEDTPKELVSAIFCKDKYAAVIYYSWSGQTYSYSLEMSWGLHYCK